MANLDRQEIKYILEKLIGEGIAFRSPDGKVKSTKTKREFFTETIQLGCNAVIIKLEHVCGDPDCLTMKALSDLRERNYDS